MAVRLIKWTAGSMAVGAAGTYFYLRHEAASRHFRRGGDIPHRMVLDQAWLQGVVDDVTDGGRLRVTNVTARSAKNLFGLRRYAPTQDSELVRTVDAWLGLRPSGGGDAVEVSLAGVVPTPEGTAWLGQHARHRHVWITLLRRRGDDLQCNVSVKKKVRWSSINKDLVKLGLCEVACESLSDAGEESPSTVESDGYRKFVHKLNVIQKRVNIKNKCVAVRNELFDEKETIIDRLSRSQKSLSDFFSKGIERVSTITNISQSDEKDASSKTECEENLEEKNVAYQDKQYESMSDNKSVSAVPFDSYNQLFHKIDKIRSVKTKVVERKDQFVNSLKKYLAKKTKTEENVSINPISEIDNTTREENGKI